jgi:soluble lytic murein transglycosylase-like protein
VGAIKTALAASVLIALSTASAAHAQYKAKPSAVDKYRLFHAAGQLYSLDPDLLAAIAAVESGGNPDAVSPKGAQGLMQLMPATASRFHVLDPFDPVSNTLGAARFISYLSQWSHDHGAGERLNLPEMIAAYNAGEGAIDKYNGIPPYPETKHYVRKVLLTYLFGDSRSDLKLKLNASEPAEVSTIQRRKPSMQQPVIIHEPDPIEKLTEIQRLRALVISREQTVSRSGGNDGSR